MLTDADVAQALRTARRGTDAAGLSGATCEHCKLLLDDAEARDKKDKNANGKIEAENGCFLETQKKFSKKSSANAGIHSMLSSKTHSFRETSESDTFTVRLCTFSKVNAKNPSETRVLAKQKKIYKKCVLSIAPGGATAAATATALLLLHCCYLLNAERAGSAHCGRFAPSEHQNWVEANG